MSAPQDDHEDDLAPTTTAGYKVGQKKTVDEYAQLDANDESLNRWKASLGIGAGGSGGSKVVLQQLVLTSPTLPPGKEVSLDLTDQQAIAATKKTPIVIKEGVEYNVGLKFKIDNEVVSGLRYIHVVKRAGIKVDKLEQMIGSYGPKPETQSVTFITEESPSGMIARSGTYEVASRVYDDDKRTHADFVWYFKLAKEW
ncbi:Rho GDP-dissociation inhibitor [Ceratobasidium sp. AG-Ba]|nr:Rho GDP-dissociation inhibitor [Ceratobasidium sp. AG-Ba]QRW05344.1 Rho GDP-dissociation inhibitor [Ceratobasidium sp. AG-Ba]